MKNRKQEDIIAEKIVKYYDYFEENSITTISKKCAKYIVNEYFEDICSNNFEIPSSEVIEEWVLEEVKHQFDEKVVEIIENTCPSMTEDEIDEQITKLEKMYERENKKQISAAANLASKELKSRIKSLQKDLIELRKKYVN
ncbi:MAG: hypothetical protein HQK78_01505 [Desulfobacterales bacterium]|nr:hypothetical protein [Desulfobacterales bacterium]